MKKYDEVKEVVFATCSKRRKIMKTKKHYNEEQILAILSACNCDSAPVLASVLSGYPFYMLEDLYRALRTIKQGT